MDVDLIRFIFSVLLQLVAAVSVVFGGWQQGTYLLALALLLKE